MHEISALSNPQIDSSDKSKPNKETNITYKKHHYRDCNSKYYKYPTLGILYTHHTPRVSPAVSERRTRCCSSFSRPLQTSDGWQWWRWWWWWWPQRHRAAPARTPPRWGRPPWHGDAGRSHWVCSPSLLDWCGGSGDTRSYIDQK